MQLIKNTCIVLGMLIIIAQAISLVRTGYLGRKLRLGTAKNYHSHMISAYYTVGLSALALLPIEISARLSRVKYPDWNLFVVHLPLAVLLISFLVAALVANGKSKWKTYHKYLVYAALMLELPVALTGAKLLWAIYTES
jgi:hypothetical protein